MENNELTANEIEILNIISKMQKWTSIRTIRKSDKDFDISIYGEGGIVGKFSAWMPLAIIQNVNYFNPKIWNLNDTYGEYIPDQEYDWSAIRDSSKEAIWKMTKIAIEMLEENELRKNVKMIVDNE